MTIMLREGRSEGRKYEEVKDNERKKRFSYANYLF